MLGHVIFLSLYGCAGRVLFASFFIFLYVMGLLGSTPCLLVPLICLGNNFGDHMSWLSVCVPFVYIPTSFALSMWDVCVR